MTQAPPLRAGVLIGGKSRRMGRPKQLLRWRGRTFVEHAVATLREGASDVDVALLGAGEVPEALSDLTRVEDAPGAGPLAGLLGALRHDREAAWLVVACDMPRLTAASVRWLVAARDPAALATIPTDAQGRAEPLLAIYEPAAREVAESLAPDQGPSTLARRPDVRRVPLPESLLGQLANVNRPEDVESLNRDGQ